MEKIITDTDLEDAIQDIVDSACMKSGIGYDDGEKTPLDIAAEVLERLGFEA